MVVITLLAAAQFQGDSFAAAKHIHGMQKMVVLRGGVSALTTHRNLQVKVCRADLSHALLFGTAPLLFPKVSWKPYIADQSLTRCSPNMEGTDIHAFLAFKLDRRLFDVWRDLHVSAALSNLAYQTTRKLSSDLYNQVMISMLYRLVRLKCDHDLFEETFRLAILALASTMFKQSHLVAKPYSHLVDRYNHALSDLVSSATLDFPASVTLWLVVVKHIMARKALSTGDLSEVWLDRSLLRVGDLTWLKARKLLRSIAWVEFVHDGPGKKTFEAAAARLYETHNSTRKPSHDVQSSNQSH